MAYVLTNVLTDIIQQKMQVVVYVELVVEDALDMDNKIVYVVHKDT